MVHAPGCRPAPQQQRRREDSHEHGHSHGSRRQVERAACEAEGHPRPGSAVHEALRRLAVAKGLVSASQLRQTVESLETARYKLRYKPRTNLNFTLSVLAEERAVSAATRTRWTASQSSHAVGLLPPTSNFSSCCAC